MVTSEVEMLVDLNLYVHCVWWYNGEMDSL